MVFTIGRWLFSLLTWIRGLLSFKRVPTAAFSARRKQCPEALAGSKLKGDAEMAPVTSCADLPIELVEEILAKCSVVELARMATTCKTFQAAFRRQQGREQKARHNLAIESFGRERIKCIAAIVDRHLKGETVHPEIGEDDAAICSISADGVLHFEGSRDDVSIPLTTPYVDIEFNIEFPDSMFLDVVHLSFGEYYMRVSRGEITRIYVHPVADGDVRSAALVQALLTGDLPNTRADLPNPYSVLAPPFSDAAQPVLLDIHRKARLRSALTENLSRDMSHPELLAIIAPLMPLASRYRCLDSSIGVWWRGVFGGVVHNKDLMQPRAVESHANNGIMLFGIVS